MTIFRGENNTFIRVDYFLPECAMFSIVVNLALIIGVNLNTSEIADSMVKTDTLRCLSSA